MTHEHQAMVFAALGDATRLRLVHRLSEQGPLTMTALAHGNAMSRQAVAKHLNVLAEAGLASSTRAGRTRIYRLEHPAIREAHQLLEKISGEWDASLDRLRAFVEE